jgi:hypothetical protein
MEICLNDACQDPLKYKAQYPCDFDKDVAPKLSAMKGGRRLPLRGAGSSTTDLIARWLWAVLDVHLKCLNIIAMQISK